MPSTLTRADVLRVAALAHLELTSAEIDLFTTQLARILEYAGEIQRVDTSGVSPTSHVFVTEADWRVDVPAGSLGRDEALANAPDPARDAGLFKVPKVL